MNKTNFYKHPIAYQHLNNYELVFEAVVSELAEQTCEYLKLIG